MITLAGVELPTPSAKLCEWIERNLPVGEAFPWAASSWAGPSLDKATPGSPAARMPRDLRVNRFTWPQGAGRWAHGAFVASARQAELVRRAANGANGQGSQPVPLVLASPGVRSDESLQVAVNLLRVVPLHSLASTNGGTPSADDDFEANNPTLLIVVDKRYAWQLAPMPDLGILPSGAYDPNSYAAATAGPVPKPPSWGAIIKKIAAAVGETIDTSTIPPAYLYPDQSLSLAGMPVGPALDAVLFNVGLRLVARYDGTFYAQSADEAVAARLADDTSAKGRRRTLQAGGDAFNNAL